MLLDTIREYVHYFHIILRTMNISIFLFIMCSSTPFQHEDSESKSAHYYFRGIHYSFHRSFALLPNTLEDICHAARQLPLPANSRSTTHTMVGTAI